MSRDPHRVFLSAKLIFLLFVIACRQTTEPDAPLVPGGEAAEAITERAEPQVFDLANVERYDAKIITVIGEAVSNERAKNYKIWGVDLNNRGEVAYLAEKSGARHEHFVLPSRRTNRGRRDHRRSATGDKR